MTSTEFLAQNGITEASLSPSVKEGINQVLKAATMEGVSQLGKILKEEAQKRGVTIGGTTTDASQAQAEAAVLAAKEKYEAEQAAAKRKKIIWISVGAVVLLVAVVVGVFYLKKKP